MAGLRIIPRLDIKGDNLVKGIHLEGLRVLGKPEEFAAAYYQEGADELLFVDAVASLYGRNSLLPLIERTAKKIFVPLAVGGGLRTIDDIRTVLRAGADKVAINTAAIKNPEFIREAARCFGSSTVVVSIEVILQKNGSYEAFTDNGRERTGKDALLWAEQAVACGAGEILLTSIDREGTGEGFDLDLIQKITPRLAVPLIVSGGAGNLADILTLAKNQSVQGIAVASLLHYNRIRHGLPVDASQFAAATNLKTIVERRGFEKIADTNLMTIKQGLQAAGVACRV